MDCTTHALCFCSSACPCRAHWDQTPGWIKCCSVHGSYPEGARRGAPRATENSKFWSQGSAESAPCGRFFTWRCELHSARVSLSGERMTIILLFVAGASWRTPSMASSGGPATWPRRRKRQRAEPPAGSGCSSCCSRCLAAGSACPPHSTAARRAPTRHVASIAFKRTRGCGCAAPPSTPWSTQHAAYCTYLAAQRRKVS